MKLLTVISPFIFAGLAASTPSWLGGTSQESLANEKPVPGQNPLYYCSAAVDDILQIDHVDLDPNPPAAGTVLKISAKGNLTEDVEDGAYVHIQVKYGLITLINQQADLCEQIKNVDLECPLEKGDTTLTKEVGLPKQIPPGKYSVLADVYTKDGDQITCLTATVIFKP